MDSQTIANCVCVALRSHDGRYYLAPRSNTKDQRGVLAFPGGDGEPGAPPRKDAARELFEETNLVPEFRRLTFLKTLGPLPRTTSQGEAWYRSHLFTLTLQAGELPHQKEPHKLGPWSLYSPEQILNLPDAAVLPGTKTAVRMTENLIRFQNQIHQQPHQEQHFALAR